MLFVTNITDVELIGGKAYNLFKAGIKNTPKFFVLSTEVTSKLDKLEKVLAEEIDKFLNNDTLYAVRSSAVDEDSNATSFAGVHDTYLNVKKEDVLEKAKLVYKSAFTPLAIQYRKENNLDTENIKIAVVIQEMIDADFAGVMNTINPVTNNPGEIVISVVKGIGEGLVGGEKDSSDYFVSGDSIKVNNEDVLDKEVLKKLVNMAKEVASKYDHFQDIEFAVKGNEVYFLQTRDITPYKNIECHKRINVLDNSNIIESYYGVTSPLTFSFARDIYEKVYTSTLNLGKVRKKIMDTLAPSLSTMLIHYKGRIYYSLNSWYHVNSIFPGKNTKSYMENMMGVKSSVDNTKKLKLNLIDMLRLGIRFLSKLNQIEKLSDEFENKFFEIIGPYYGRELNGTNEELITLYKTIEKELVPLFTTPIINDSALMICFGRLRNKVDKLKGVDKKKLLARAISTNGNVKSVESATKLIEIRKYIDANPDLKNDFDNLGEIDLYNKYHDGDLEITKMINNYVNEFGCRVMDELKLETITMIENPYMVYSYLKTTTPYEEQELIDVEIPKNIVKSAKKAAKFVKNRERLRLKRTYIFSVVRNIFLGIARNLYKENLIKDERDIFYLTKEEIFAGDSKKYIEIIEQRKQQEVQYKQETVTDRVVLYEGGELNVRDNITNLCGIGSGYEAHGVVQILNSPTDKVIPGSIILTKRTDPGWIALFSKINGLIVEHGSMMSHSFVVAREMHIAAVVGVKGVFDYLKDGDKVYINGLTGDIKVEN